jgi:hypothetical protein
MKKSNDIGKIGLMIADKQNIFSRQVFNMLRSGNFQPV